MSSMLFVNTIILSNVLAHPEYERVDIEAISNYTNPQELVSSLMTINEIKNVHIFSFISFPVGFVKDNSTEGHNPYFFSSFYGINKSLFGEYLYLLKGSFNFTDGIFITQRFQKMFGFDVNDTIYLKYESKVFAKFTVQGIVSIRPKYKYFFEISEVLFFMELNSTIEFKRQFAEKFNIPQICPTCLFYYLSVYRSKIVVPWSFELTSRNLDSLENKIISVTRDYELSIARNNLKNEISKLSSIQQSLYLYAGLFLFIPVLFAFPIFSQLYSRFLVSTLSKELKILSVRGVKPEQARNAFLIMSVFYGFLFSIIGSISGYILVVVATLPANALLYLHLVLQYFLTVEFVVAFLIAVVYSTILLTYIFYNVLQEISLYKPSQDEYKIFSNHEFRVSPVFLIVSIILLVMNIGYIVMTNLTLPAGGSYLYELFTSFFNSYLSVNMILMPLYLPYLLTALIVRYIYHKRQTILFKAKEASKAIAFPRKTVLKTIFIIALLLSYSASSYELYTMFSNTEKSLLLASVGSDINAEVLSYNTSIIEEINKIECVNSSAFLVHTNGKLLDEFIEIYFVNPDRYYKTISKNIVPPFSQADNRKTLESLNSTINGIILSHQMQRYYDIKEGESVLITFSLANGHMLKLNFTVVGFLPLVWGSIEFTSQHSYHLPTEYDLSFGIVNIAYNNIGECLKNGTLGNSAKILIKVSSSNNVDYVISKLMEKKYILQVVSATEILYMPLRAELYASTYFTLYLIQNLALYGSMLTIACLTMLFVLLLISFFQENKRNIAKLIVKGATSTQILKIIASQFISLIVIASFISIVATFSVLFSFSLSIIPFLSSIISENAMMPQSHMALQMIVISAIVLIIISTILMHILLMSVKSNMSKVTREIY